MTCDTDSGIDIPELLRLSAFGLSCGSIVACEQTLTEDRATWAEETFFPFIDADVIDFALGDLICIQPGYVWLVVASESGFGNDRTEQTGFFADSTVSIPKTVGIGASEILGVIAN